MHARHVLALVLSRRGAACLAMVAAANLMMAATAAAQPQTDAKAAVQKAFETSKGASTVEAFTSVIAACDEAKKIELSAANAKYIADLAAWAYNRRGELRVAQAKEHAARGDRAKAAEADQQALSDFDASVKLDATKYKPLNNRGVSLAQAGKIAEAEADFSAAIELKNDYADLWFNRAELRLELRNFTEAIRDYNRFIELQPRDFWAYTGRGHALFSLGRRREALSDYAYALQMAGNVPEQRAIALTHHADAYRSLALGQTDPAKARQYLAYAAGAYRQAIGLAPEYGRAYERGAWMAATCPVEEFRNADLALQLARRAIEIDGEGADHLDTLAAALANRGDFAQAKQTLQKAIGLAPNWAKPAMQERLALYETSKPYRDNVSSESSE